MPLYEYACTACGERTEARQSFDDPPLEECRACGGLLRKLFSPVGIVFKGTGFYSTDAKKRSSKDSEPKSDAKSDAKSEPKKDSTKERGVKSETKKRDSQSSAGKEKSA